MTTDFACRVAADSGSPRRASRSATALRDDDATGSLLRCIARRPGRGTRGNHPGVSWHPSDGWRSDGSSPVGTTTSVPVPRWGSCDPSETESEHIWTGCLYRRSERLSRIGGGECGLNGDGENESSHALLGNERNTASGDSENIWSAVVGTTAFQSGSFEQATCDSKLAVKSERFEKRQLRLPQSKFCTHRRAGDCPLRIPPPSIWRQVHRATVSPHPAAAEVGGLRRSLG